VLLAGSDDLRLGAKFAKVAEEVLIESLKIWNDPKSESQQKVQRTVKSCRRWIRRRSK